MEDTINYYGIVEDTTKHYGIVEDTINYYGIVEDMTKHYGIVEDTINYYGLWKTRLTIMGCGRHDQPLWVVEDKVKLFCGVFC